jgi:hypothetical protein
LDPNFSGEGVQQKVWIKSIISFFISDSNTFGFFKFLQRYFACSVSPRRRSAASWKLLIRMVMGQFQNSTVWFQIFRACLGLLPERSFLVDKRTHKQKEELT